MRSFIISLLLAIGSFVSITAQTNSYWKLVFEDSFEGDSFDPATWSYSTRAHPDWKKYIAGSPSTVTTEDGVLKVRLIKNPDMVSDPVPYLSGGIESRGKFSFLYGKAEVRAKFNNGQGSWPAIWMMPENNIGGWPHGGEIDIMEHLNADNIVYQTIHSGYESNNPPKGNTTQIDKNDWNVYGFEWYPDRLDFTINGKITFTYPRIMPFVAAQWPFDKEFYFILNMAGGGNWSGPINDSHLPFEMQVDWVRVFKINPESPYTYPQWQSPNRAQDDAHWKDTYVESITSKGTASPFNYQALKRPDNYYTIIEDTLLVYPGQSFQLQLEGFSLGEYSESVIKQDIRYTNAYVFADFDGDHFFETSIARTGKVPPASNIGGNIESLNVEVTLSSQESNLNKTGRIRVIYHNAWSGRTSPDKPVYEGLVYDIPVRTVNKVNTGNLAPNSPGKISRTLNTIQITDVAIHSQVRIYDLRGQLLIRDSINQYSFTMTVPDQMVIIQLIDPDGMYQSFIR
jgi:beta-glucanase (GH16 family)